MTLSAFPAPSLNISPDTVEFEEIASSMLLWHNRPHRDDMATYPDEKREYMGWQEISAAANALIYFHPELVFESIEHGSL